VELTYNGSSAKTNSDVTGDKATLIVKMTGATPTAGDGITAVDWTVTGKEYSNQTYTSSNGITNIPYMPSNVHSANNTFYWDEHAGSRNITAVVHFAKSPNITLMATVNVVQPTGNIKNTFGGKKEAVPGISGGNHLWYDVPTLAVPNPYGIGFGFVVNSNSTAGKGGQFGLVQTITASSDERSYVNANGILYVEKLLVSLPGKGMPRPVLDDAKSPVTQIYYADKVGDVKQPNVTTTVTTSDNPNGPLNQPWNNYSIQDSFSDTLMFQASNGIKVPVGKMTWTYTAHAFYNATTGTYQLNPGASSSATHTTYTPTTTFPAWSASAAALLKNGDGGWVQTSP
jgi:hypothetical protein